MHDLRRVHAYQINSEMPYNQLGQSSVTNSLYTPRNLELFLPIQVYNPDILEVGDPLCSICYEDYAEGVSVRKLG
jgi:hypothetical protein